ncbi:MAG TPA: glycosyltransferase family 2 protein [Pyrinomonadaceae bacterium]|nr:glycosyltransferase family 2 protein [Pyrinomonadaceae bacterium]
MKAELAIVIVNWNGGDFLRSCLDSVVHFPPTIPFEVIVVDNASTDGSREWLQSQQNVRLIANTENVGFGRANNQAFEASDAPTLFLLNSDAEVHAGAFDKLLTTINEDEKIGVVGPRLLNTDGTLQPSVWRNPFTSFEMIMTTLRLHKLLPKRWRGDLLLGFHWDHMQRRSVRMLSGAALLVRRKVIDDVGGFDERFHMYGEDTEWALRIVRGGWLLIFQPAATVTHHGGKSAAKRWLDLDKREKEYEGFFRFQRLQLSRRQTVTNLMTGYLLSLIRYAWLTLRRKPREESRLVRRLYRDELHRCLFAGKSVTEVPAQIAKRPL